MISFTTSYRAKFVFKAYEGWIPQHSSILDIGCGSCIISQKIAKHFNCDVVGTDLFDYGKQRVPFRLMRTNKLPFKDKTFDIAMLNDTLHHCIDWLAMLEEAKRVANKVLIFEPHPVPLWFESFVNWFHYKDMHPAINMKTLNEWLGYLNPKEFRKIKVPFWYPFKHFAFKLSNSKANDQQ